MSHLIGKANADSEADAADVEHGDVLREGLQKGADDEEDAARDHDAAAAQPAVPHAVVGHRQHRNTFRVHSAVSAPLLQR